jgi:hypothetical protein
MDYQALGIHGLCPYSSEDLYLRLILYLHLHIRVLFLN